MIVARLLDRSRWERLLWRASKNTVDIVRPRRDSKPVFVLGKQRSGTTMLMEAFHRHTDLMVYEEAKKSRAFEDDRLKEFETIKAIIDRSSFPRVCFKPICDSHRVAEIVENFPGAHIVWLYRDYRDVANSSLRKWPTATRAIRLICEGKPGGGWLAEGVSEQMRGVLAELYSESLSDFDLSCVVWWIRNRCVVESGLMGTPNLTLLKYENLVAQPAEVMSWLFGRLSIPFQPKITRRLHSRSVGRNPAPQMNESVYDCCEGLLGELDEEYFRVRGQSA